MFFKLSLNNIRRSVKDYTIYFLTLILGISIFYIFNAIETQNAMLEVSNAKSEIMELTNGALSGVSVFVSFVLGFLIVYASRFLIKKRKKEFGLYMTLGMSKRDISKILLVETILIGVISLVIGLIVGIGLSQFMSIVVANMFEANMDNFTFVLSKSAILKTCMYFAIIYLVVMVFNTISIGKSKLIDLISASKKQEKIKLKNPIICGIIFIASCLMLAYAYYNVTTGAKSLETEKDILIQIGLGAVATFLIFWSISGLFIRWCKRIPKLYNRNLNVFSISEISSKINTTVVSGGIICLLLFMTICILSSAFTLKESMNKNIEKYTPVDVNLFKDMTSSDKPVKDFLTEQNIDDSKFKDVIDGYTYINDTVTSHKLMGDYIKTIEANYGVEWPDKPETIMKLSDYNKIARMYKIEEYSLNDDEYIIVANYKDMVEVWNNALKKENSITLGDKTYHPKYLECKDGFISITSNMTNMGIILVPDNVELTEQNYFENYYIANYNVDKQDLKELEEYMNSKKIEDSSYAQDVDVNTKTRIYDNSVGLSAACTFIGLYLGIIFMISSAAILALKELSESIDNKEKYIILRKIGADEKMINRSLFTQIAIFFSFPLVLAIIHSIFGIQTCNLILSTFGNEGLLTSIIITSIIIVLIYGSYFIVTYLCSKNMIKEK